MPFNAWRDYDGDEIYDDLHEGIDFVADDVFGLSSAVVAVASGEVVWASNRWQELGTPSPYGNHIVIEHGNGLLSTYAHLAVMMVDAGDIVYVGQVIGVVGETGRSYGIHLHYMLQYPNRGLSGYPVPDIIDPTPFFDY